MQRSAAAQTQPLKIGQPHSHGAAEYVAERVAAGIAVGSGIVGRSDPQAVEDDDRRPPRHSVTPGLHEAEAHRRERRLEQLLLVRLQLPLGLAL